MFCDNAIDTILVCGDKRSFDHGPVLIKMHTDRCPRLRPLGWMKVFEPNEKTFLQPFARNGGRLFHGFYSGDLADRLPETMELFERAQFWDWGSRFWPKALVLWIADERHHIVRLFKHNKVIVPEIISTCEFPVGFAR